MVKKWFLNHICSEYGLMVQLGIRSVILQVKDNLKLCWQSLKVLFFIIEISDFKIFLNFRLQQKETTKGKIDPSLTYTVKPLITNVADI